MKALFFTFNDFKAYDGISKKIHHQVKALIACGIDTKTIYYDITPDGKRRWMADNEIIDELGVGIIAKIKKRIDYTPIINYVRKEKIDFVYIRTFHNANPFTINMVKRIKQLGAKVVIEIPSYPYDKEYVTSRMKFQLFIHRHYRYRLARKIDAIVTFTNDKYIFGQRTICISNGIDFDSIPLRKIYHDTTPELHLIGVAEIHFWHGFDRLIRGLADYYCSNPTYKVYFHLVGSFFGEQEKEDILSLIKDNHLEQYIILYGACYGEKLEEIFSRADFAIGSLGRHRSGITAIKTLKNREYAARGFSFIYSETDEDFDNQPYILKVPPDESPIDIPDLIAFQRSVTYSPAEIRQSIKHLSWKEQMSKVISEIKKIK